ncbi:TAF6-like RNA polymerase II p300/CBP-associated factor-associated factor 65 kDa subunit 6L [Melanerpes formicivorus]|uniref:TAF6-like RNA polymerase II p300/CBP-associated factor-associated factor 65 kDa subunit 6L n=1 Tax=Melanerpes formicivorus TaxID=211600 RepID=UPI00358EA16F
MSEREERRFVELPRESVRLMAESTGLELSDEVAALLAEDVCYRLREATQNSSQFLKHRRRRRLTVEDFNRALRWSNVEVVFGYGSQDSLPFRTIKEGDLFFQEDREVNLVELALATNIPKGCAETTVRVHISYLDGKGNLEPQGAVPSAVSTLTEDLLKYYQNVTRAVLGDDPQLMKVALQDLQTNSKIAALLPYFVYVVSGVKSVSHDLEQLSRLLHIARSLILNPFICLGSYVRSLISSVIYCTLEPLAASINPLNDHWTLRDYAAMLLSRIFWTHGDLVSGLYHQILLSLQKVLADPVRPLCSHYGAVVGLHALGWKAVERVLYPQLPTYWANLQAVLDDYSVSNAQVKADGHKVYGAILVAVERLLKMKAQPPSPPSPFRPPQDSSPLHSPTLEPLPEPSLAPGRCAAAAGGGGRPVGGGGAALSLQEMYQELYDFFGDSLAARFGTAPPPAPRPSPPRPRPPPAAPSATLPLPPLTGECPPGAPPPPQDAPADGHHRPGGRGGCPQVLLLLLFLRRSPPGPGPPPGPAAPRGLGSGPGAPPRAGRAPAPASPSPAAAWPPRGPPPLRLPDRGAADGAALPGEALPDLLPPVPPCRPPPLALRPEAAHDRPQPPARPPLAPAPSTPCTSCSEPMAALGIPCASCSEPTVALGIPCTSCSEPGQPSGSPAPPALSQWRPSGSPAPPALSQR